MYVAHNCISIQEWDASNSSQLNYTYNITIDYYMQFGYHTNLIITHTQNNRDTTKWGSRD